jgi:hypothetical protein
MSPFSRKTKVVAAGAVLIFVALVVALLYQPAPPADVLPHPNGYDDFIKAGQELTGDPYSYRDGGGEKELRTFVADNAEPLRLLRTGLKRDCRVPLEYSQSYLTTHIPRLALLKRLAQTQAAEGNLAQMEHRGGDAARAYLATIQLGHEATRGGVLIDGLVGVAIEALGSTPLQAVVSNLNAKECRETLQALEMIDSKRERFAEILKHEKQWSRRTFPWYLHAVGSLQRLFKSGSLQQAQQKASQKFQSIEQRRRKLMIDLAAQAYELENGQRPKALADLVPGYLKAVPQDPATGTNMVYIP